MSAFPFYIVLVLLVCVALVWSGLILDLFGMRCWMHQLTDLMETQLKGPDSLQ